MGLYVAYTKSLSSRNIKDLFLIRASRCYAVKEGEVKDIFEREFPVNELLDNLLTHCLEDSIPSFEILLGDGIHLEEEAIKNLFSYLADSLKDKDLSVGLLTKFSNFVPTHKELLNELGITYVQSSNKRKEVFKAKPLRQGVKSKLSNKAFPERDPRFSNLSLEFAAAPQLASAEMAKHLCLAKPGKSIKLEESFHDKFLRFLNESNMDNVEVYTRGGISRQVFSNVLSSKDLIPSKPTVICLIIGLRLPLPKAIELLSCAGYSLSRSILFDSIVLSFFAQGNFNLDSINYELNENGCALLGWHPRKD